MAPTPDLFITPHLSFWQNGAKRFLWGKAQVAHDRVKLSTSKELPQKLGLQNCRLNMPKPKKEKKKIQNQKWCSKIWNSGDRKALVHLTSYNILLSKCRQMSKYCQILSKYRRCIQSQTVYIGYMWHIHDFHIDLYSVSKISHWVQIDKLSQPLWSLTSQHLDPRISDKKPWVLKQ